MRQSPESPATPSIPRDAATVLLLRDGVRADGSSVLEVYLLRRARSMAFAGGMTAYPGGGVDPRDADADIGWRGPTASEWASAFGCDETTARALVCAVVRETFEESGVLLATSNGSGDDGVPDTSRPDWEADRQALLDNTLSLAELLTRRGLVLRADLLRPFAHWITPVEEPRRFDTKFFAAALPPGAQARDISGEADQAGWYAVTEALAEYEREERAMLPPTVQTLRDLAGYPTVADVLAGAPPRPITPIVPHIETDPDGSTWATLPDGTRIPRAMPRRTAG